MTNQRNFPYTFSPNKPAFLGVGAKMDITWLGRSAIRLASNDVTLITDPFAGDGGQTPDADIIALSDAAGGGWDASNAGEARVIEGPGQYEALGYNISGMGTALEDADGGRRINTVYVIRSDGVSVCHLGALKGRLSGRQLDSLGAVDVLLAPAGAGSGVSPQDVARMAGALSPGIVIPIGYEPEDADAEDSPLNALVRAMNAERPTPQPRLSVTQNNLPRQTRVAALTVRR